MDTLAFSAPFAAVIALVFAFGLTNWVGKQDPGTDRMKEISGYIREGAMAFLRREYQYMVIVIVILFLVLGFRFEQRPLYHR